jgi:hypothetical protein
VTVEGIIAIIKRHQPTTRPHTKRTLQGIAWRVKAQGDGSLRSGIMWKLQGQQEPLLALVANRDWEA